MRIAVSNSGPLIHLARIGLIDLLFKLFEKIIIPESVFNEVVIKGKEEGYSDAIIIEQAISNNKIEVKKVIMKTEEFSSSKLHEGELNAIKLTIDSNIELILLDDEEARILARRLKLKVKGTLGILIDLVKNRYLELKNALQFLKDLNSIMYLSSDVYNLVLEKLKIINQKE